MPLTDRLSTLTGLSQAVNEHTSGALIPSFHRLRAVAVRVEEFAAAHPNLDPDTHLNLLTRLARSLDDHVERNFPAVRAVLGLDGEAGPDSPVVPALDLTPARTSPAHQLLLGGPAPAPAGHPADVAALAEVLADYDAEADRWRETCAAGDDKYPAVAELHSAALEALAARFADAARALTDPQ